VSTIRTALVMLDSRARRAWVGLVFLSVVVAGAEALGAAALYAFIRIVANPDAAYALPVVRTLVAPERGAAPSTVVMTATVALVLLYLTKNGMLAAIAWRQCGWAARSRAALAERVYGAYLGAPWAFRLQRSSAELIRNVTTAVDAVFRHVLGPAMVLTTESLVLLSIGAVLLATAPAVTLAVAIGIGGTGTILLAATRARSSRWSGELSRLEREILQGAQQTLGAAKELRVLDREAFFVAEFAQRQTALVGVRRASEALAAMPRLLVETVFVLAALGLVLLATLLGRTGPELLPLLGLYAYAGFRVIPSANRWMMSVNEVRLGAAPTRELADDLARLAAIPRQVEDPEDPEPIDFESALELDQVEFAYEGADRPALRDLCLKIRRGESIGLVGPTGAGKTTLVDVLTGLLTPTSGRLLVDGRPLRASAGGWQRSIGYVPQAVFLIDDSLRRNVALAVPEAEIDPARLSAAIEAAQLAELVASLPRRLDTIVGENGFRLSGGQRQRVGIARALYHSPSLLVLDEATSALDGQTETALLEAIERSRGRCTLIVVAHRMSTVRSCDRLVMMAEGRVAGVGRYEELLRDSPTFRLLAEGGAAVDPTCRAS
jgi:ATP-binding cassette, subfamily B, bacterial PglK